MKIKIDETITMMEATRTGAPRVAVALFAA
jgi:hypothetical protein